MRALVVFESMFGNTETVARAIADGLARHGDVEISEVGRAPREVGGFDLVVVGGPTHAFGMSRDSTRRDATKQSDRPVVSGGIGMREWIEALGPAPGGAAVATFDTRIRKPRVPGSAARAAAKRLGRLGYRIVAPPENFWVSDSKGPLFEGEVDRARTWGDGVAARVPAAGSRSAT